MATRLKASVAGQACFLFAVFDGHGGVAASRCCAAHVAAVVDVLLWPVARSLATSPEDLASQLQHVAVQACLELQRAFAASGRIGGCTATLVLQAGRLVTVASLGSSRCVLSTGSGGLATLSAQHVISANQQELQRLLKAGCHVAPQEPGSPGPAASPRSGGGVLRLWPGGCTGGVVREGMGAEADRPTYTCTVQTSTQSAQVDACTARPCSATQAASRSAGRSAILGSARRCCRCRTSSR